jgi:hypothetical protein
MVNSWLRIAATREGTRHAALENPPRPAIGRIFAANGALIEQMNGGPCARSHFGCIDS